MRNWDIGRMLGRLTKLVPGKLLGSCQGESMKSSIAQSGDILTLIVNSLLGHLLVLGIVSLV